MILSSLRAPIYLNFCMLPPVYAITQWAPPITPRSVSAVAQVPGYEDRIKSLEVFRLKMILRLLKISSFNGKMNALNEVNKVRLRAQLHI